MTALALPTERAPAAHVRLDGVRRGARRASGRDPAREGARGGHARLLPRLVHDPALRLSLAIRGGRRAEQLGWDAVFDGLFSQYRDVIAGRGREPAPPNLPALALG